MESLEQFDFGARGRASSYDYEKLFDGGIYRLKRGVDFASAVKVQSVRSGLATRANKAGFSLRTSIEGDDSIVIQASSKTDRAAPAKKPAARRRPAAKKSSAKKATSARSGVNPEALVA